MDTLPRAFSSTRAAGGVGDLGPLVDKLEHTARAGQGVLQLRHHAGDLVKGLGVLVGVA